MNRVLVLVDGHGVVSYEFLRMSLVVPHIDDAHRHGRKVLSVATDLAQAEVVRAHYETTATPGLRFARSEVL